MGISMFALLLPLGLSGRADQQVMRGGGGDAAGDGQCGLAACW
jgi:hypothetical protein